MGKNLFITEKPSVAIEFANALGGKKERKDGYIESDEYIVTWCVGHLVTMSYPEAYDPDLKRWSMDALPFLPNPNKYRYEVLPGTAKQYEVVRKFLNSPKISCIYYSGDSAREGEYIQRLVRELAGHRTGVPEKRVWIDSQTEEEIRRGIQYAKPLSDYDSLSESAYARAIEDYGIGINLSRALTLKYGSLVAQTCGESKAVIAVGRVMSCVLGMVIRREREIRNNVKTVYYVVKSLVNGKVEASWKPVENSKLYTPDDLYEKKGFLRKEDAERFCIGLGTAVEFKEGKFSHTKKAAPLLYNLAELQGECTKRFRFGPDKTLEIVQSLYEKKLTTYPRTDARVLTTAVCAVIGTNLKGLGSLPEYSGYVQDIFTAGTWKSIAKTKYTNDAAVSDHYAIIPTGKTAEVNKLTDAERNVYHLICRRFLSIFMPPAEFEKMVADFIANGECFHCSAENLLSPGWLGVAGKIPDTSVARQKIATVKAMRQGSLYPASFSASEEATQAPKRYTSGSMILAMENAGKLIDDEELRAQIKGSGIGTSATRAETIKKLISNQYIKADKNQILSPTLQGEAVFEAIQLCTPRMLSAEITASWEKGLQQIVDHKISKEEYLAKMYSYISNQVVLIKGDNHGNEYLRQIEKNVKPFYPKVKPAAVQGQAELKCPLCGRSMRLWEGSYFCTGKENGCTFVLWKRWCGREIPEGSMRALLSGKTTPKLTGFQSKSGNEFSARLKLESGKVVPIFDPAPRR